MRTTSAAMSFQESQNEPFSFEESQGQPELGPEPPEGEVMSSQKDAKVRKTSVLGSMKTTLEKARKVIFEKERDQEVMIKALEIAQGELKTAHEHLERVKDHILEVALNSEEE